MEALLVLVLLPMIIGVVAELIFRDTTKASFAATLGCPLAVFVCLRHLEPDGRLSWLATLLVSPFAIAFALAAVLWLFGRMRPRKRNGGKRA